MSSRRGQFSPASSEKNIKSGAFHCNSDVSSLQAEGKHISVPIEIQTSSLYKVATVAGSTQTNRLYVVPCSEDLPDEDPYATEEKSKTEKADGAVQHCEPEFVGTVIDSHEMLPVAFSSPHNTSENLLSTTAMLNPVDEAPQTLREEEALLLELKHIQDYNSLIPDSNPQVTLLPQNLNNINTQRPNGRTYRLNMGNKTQRVGYVEFRAVPFKVHKLIAERANPPSGANAAPQLVQQRNSHRQITRVSHEDRSCASSGSPSPQLSRQLYALNQQKHKQMEHSRAQADPNKPQKNFI